MIALHQEVDHFLKTYFEKRAEEIEMFSPRLMESMAYSLYNGGKRFRPSLCLQATELLGGKREEALAYAAAVEMVHTYSLIHDDLPCMDNDSVRRGQPTNHIRFGEPLALLAGDGLLTEAFYLIAQHYEDKGTQAALLVGALSRAAGSSGMVGGQAMDMGLGVATDSFERLLLSHGGKTAALIACTLEGAAIVAGLDKTTAQELRVFGEKLGLAFQVKDDILDGETNSPNSVLFHGDIKAAEEYLLKLKDEAKGLLKNLPPQCEQLLQFFIYNEERSL
jgi:geranylgeranyl diphosphate synthase, type II